MKKYGHINFYMDTCLVNDLFGNGLREKRAQDGGTFSSIIQSVKHYVENQIDPNDKIGSLLNILVPGAITMFFGGKLGWLIGLALRVFHIDISGILKSIYEEIKSILTSKKEINSSQVDQIVNQSVQEHSNVVEASVLNSQDIRMLSLMMTTNQTLTKDAQLFGDLFSSRKSKMTSVLSKVLGWLFKVAIASAGLMVAGDVINKLIGRPNAIDNTVQKGKPITQPESSLPVSTQSNFPLNPSYTNQTYNVSTPWIEKIINNKQNIDNMLIDFSKDVYEDLDGLDSSIRATPGFQAVLDKIVWFNHTAPNDKIVFIPKIFISKKQIVDLFIDDVAHSSNKGATSVKFARHKSEYNWKNS